MQRHFPRALTLLFIALVSFATFGQAQQGYYSQPQSVEGFDEVAVRYAAQVSDEGTLKVRAIHSEGYHTYAFDNKARTDGDGNENTKITVSGGLRVTGPWVADEEHDLSTPVGKNYGYSGMTVFEAPIERMNGDAALVTIQGAACNEQGCLMPHSVGIELDLSDVVGVVMAADLGSADNNSNVETQPTPESANTESKASGAELTGLGNTGKLKKVGDNWYMDPWQGKTISEDQGWFEFILFCIGGGLIALLMPCVFPMIPITVSFFGKQAESTGKSTLGLGLIYGIGLMASYTGLGFLLTSLKGASGVSDFGNNPWVAVGIAIFFTVFALSMFGMFELRLPSGLAQKFNVQGKAGGVGGSFLLGSTFAVTSMACTVPVVGFILTFASQGHVIKPLVGMLVYSAVVALPFVILAAVPGLLKKVPKAGGWMQSVKIIFGFIELAAAAEFLGWAKIISRETVISVWLACTVLATLYLLGIFRSSHDAPTNGIGAGRITFATLFLATAFWLLTGLFGAKLGVIEPFLVSPVSAEWEDSPDLEEVLTMAKKEGKPVFLDFTGPS